MACCCLMRAAGSSPNSAWVIRPSAACAARRGSTLGRCRAALVASEGVAQARNGSDMACRRGEGRDGSAAGAEGAWALPGEPAVQATLAWSPEAPDAEPSAVVTTAVPVVVAVAAAAGTSEGSTCTTLLMSEKASTSHGCAGSYFHSAPLQMNLKAILRSTSMATRATARAGGRLGEGGSRWHAHANEPDWR